MYTYISVKIYTEFLSNHRGICIGVVRPSLSPSFLPSVRYSFCAISQELRNGFQWNFEGRLYSKKRGVFFSPSRSDNSTRMHCPWLIMHYAYTRYAICIYGKIGFHAVNQLLVIGFKWNFVGGFKTKKRDAYHSHV